MRYREGQPDDQENVQKAYELLMDFIEIHQKEIEPSLWVGAMVCALAENYEKSGVPFSFFKIEMVKAVQNYKY